MELALSLSLCRPGGISLEQLVAALFSAGEQGAWYDPSGNNTTWRRNRLTYTQEFDNAAWSKTNSAITANSTTAPDGTSTADKLIASVSTGGVLTHFMSQAITLLAGTTNTYSVYLKEAEFKWAIVYIGSVGAGKYIDLVNGVAGSNFVGAPLTTDITSAGNGWWRVAITFASGGFTAGDVRIYTALANGNSTSTGDDTSGLLVWGAQLDWNATTASAYQRIITPEITYLSTVQAQPLLFQDSAGTLPVTEVEQPVGLMLDRRKGLALGSELITNAADREFSSDTGYWSLAATAAITSGVLRLTAAANNVAQATRNSVFAAGKWYKATCTIKNYSSGAIRLCVNDNTYQLPAANGTYSVIFYSTLWSVTAFSVRSIGTSTTLDVDDVSAKEIDGNHAYQTTSSARPHLRSRYNLLTYSEQFGTNWSAPSTDIDVTSNAIEAPDGTTTADKIIAKATFSVHRVSQNVSVATSATYTFSIYVKAAERSIVQLKMASGFTVEPIVEFDVSGSGTKTTIQGSPTSTIEAVSGYPGWFRCTITATTSSSATSTNAQCFICQSAGSVFYTGDGTSGIYVWGAQLNLGSTAMSYQRIAAAPTLSQPPTYATVSTMGGEVFRPYLDFDGADSFITNSIDFSASDAVTMTAGAQKLVDASGGSIVCELSADINANNGAFTLVQYSSTTGWAFGSKGTVRINAEPTGLYTGIRKDVLTGTADISSDSVILRVNGTQAVSNTGDQGSGNYSNYPMYLGRRGGSSLPYTGYLFALIVRGAASSASEIGTLESYVAGKTGVTL